MMSNCRQKVEIFIDKEMWDKTPIDQYYDDWKNYLKIINTDEKADFIFEREKGWIQITLGYMHIKVPIKWFLIEAGTILTDLAIGKNFVAHMLKEDRKERRKRRYLSWFMKPKRNR